MVVCMPESQWVLLLEAGLDGLPRGQQGALGPVVVAVAGERRCCRLQLVGQGGAAEWPVGAGVHRRDHHAQYCPEKNQNILYITSLSAKQNEKCHR